MTAGSRDAPGCSAEVEGVGRGEGRDGEKSQGGDGQGPPPLVAGEVARGRSEQTRRRGEGGLVAGRGAAEGRARSRARPGGGRAPHHVAARSAEIGGRAGGEPRVGRRTGEGRGRGGLGADVGQGTKGSLPRPG